MPQALTTTSHRAAVLTATSALALYDAANCNADKLRAAAAMAEVLRRGAEAKPKAKKALGDTLTAENLVAAMKRVCAIIERRNSIPMLSCVLLESGSDFLRLTATDLDVLYVETLEAPQGGLPTLHMAVPAHDLAAALRGCTGEVTFVDSTIHPEPGATVERSGNKTQADGSVKWETWKEPELPQLRLSVIAGGATTRFAALPAADFPIMQTPKHHDGVAYLPATAKMDSSVLLEPLAFVHAAISAEETRYYLNGAYMHTVIADGAARLTFVATDDSRLLLDRQETGRSPFPPNAPAVILPRKSVDWMLRHLGAGEISVDLWPQQVMISAGNRTFQTKVIDGTFPDYTRVIPADKGRAVLEVSEVKAFAAVLAKLASQTREKSASFHLIAKDGKVEATARNLDGGSMRADLPAEHAGEDMTLGFNARLMSEIVLRGGLVTIDLAGPNDPVRFLWPDQPGRTGVLMPLRV